MSERLMDMLTRFALIMIIIRLLGRRCPACLCPLVCDPDKLELKLLPWSMDDWRPASVTFNKDNTIYFLRNAWVDACTLCVNGMTSEGFVINLGCGWYVFATGSGTADGREFSSVMIRIANRVTTDREFVYLWVDAVCNSGIKTVARANGPVPAGSSVALQLEVVCYKDA